MPQHNTAHLQQDPGDGGAPRSRPPHDYTEDVIRRALEHYEHFEALAQTTHFLRHRDDLTSHPEDLLCLYLDLKQGIRLLPLRQRKAVVLHLVLGYTETETAERLHISRMSVYERIQAGLTNLRKLLNSTRHPLRGRGVVTPLRRRSAPATAVAATA